MYPQTGHFPVKYYFCSWEWYLHISFSPLPLLNHSLSFAQLSRIRNIWPSQKDAFRGRQGRGGRRRWLLEALLSSKLMPWAWAGKLFHTGNTILKMVSDQYLESLTSAQSRSRSLTDPKQQGSHFWTSADEYFQSYSQEERALYSSHNLHIV